MPKINIYGWEEKKGKKPIGKIRIPNGVRDIKKFREKMLQINQRKVKLYYDVQFVNPTRIKKLKG